MCEEKLNVDEGATEEVATETVADSTEEVVAEQAPIEEVKD